MAKLFALAAISATFLLAGPTATLTGRVTDTSGEEISAVRVTATNVETNLMFPAETNAEGLYHIPNLPPGTYRVIVQKFAFRTVVKPDVELHVQDVIGLNFSMELGSVTESVMVEGGAPLIQASAARGGDFVASEVRDLPLPGLNPLSLARTLPGTLETAGTAIYGSDPAAAFSVNGARFRANNYLLDSTENNDFTQTGIAQPFNIADAVEEVAVQTGNFGVEFGRAGGAILNVVTKSGTNSSHETLLWRYQSQRFNSKSNLDQLNQIPKSVFSRNVYGFTVGGPVRKDRTFFFVAFQEDSLRSTASFPLVVPTDAAVSALRSLFPSNPRLDFYLKFLGDVRGTANPITLQLGDDPKTGLNRGIVKFATAPLALLQSHGGPEWLVRIDHNLSDAHRLAFRYIRDAHTDAPVMVYFPGFITDQTLGNQNFLVTDHYTFSPNWTNEFRFSYGRQVVNGPEQISSSSVPEAETFPYLLIGRAPGGGPLVSTPGVRSFDLQARETNNLLFQEAQSKLSGRHTFRYGGEFLRQLASQRPSAVYNGQVTYTEAAGYSVFANFLDDFSGPSGRIQRDFGATIFYPDQFHQTYYFQDTWLPAPSLNVTMGLRYENFGQVANALKYPAFAGFDPASFLKPNRVDTDNKDFGPAFGLAWSPSFDSGVLGKLFGRNKTVWRSGYQITYDPLFTQAVSSLLAVSSPNAISTVINAPGSGRGSPNWFGSLPASASAPGLLDSQRGVFEKDFRNPYTERWSFGFQRQFAGKFVVDGSYVGSESHRLATLVDLNYRLPSLQRLYPDFGPRQIRASNGNSSYHAMQWRVNRQFANGFQANVSYTWSRNIDSTSEGIGTVNNQQPTNMNVTSIPVALGGMKLDRGPSDYDRTHRFTAAYIWYVPGPARNRWKYALGGWSISGITTFQSGAPFTVANGFDRNNDGIVQDRPDIGNPNAALNSRAVITPATGSQSCSTGYRNPDTGQCVSPSDVHWIQGTGQPNGATVGRNTLNTGGIANFDVDLTKTVSIGEGRRLEFRWEAFNAFNHPQFTSEPAFSVGGAAPGRFLNRDFIATGIRTMWAQVRVVF